MIHKCGRELGSGINAKRVQKRQKQCMLCKVFYNPSRLSNINGRIVCILCETKICVYVDDRNMTEMS